MAARARRSTVEVRRRALRLIRELDLDVPLDAAALCARLGEHRGRPVRLVPHSFAHSSIFGLWVGTASADHVFVERDTTASHQRHIVLHEVGHIEFDHGDDGGGESLWKDLAVALPRELPADARPRGGYDSAFEYEAELFASIIEDWAATMAVTREERGGRSALHEAFDDPWGWR